MHRESPGGQRGFHGSRIGLRVRQNLAIGGDHGNTDAACRHFSQPNREGRRSSPDEPERAMKAEEDLQSAIRAMAASCSKPPRS